MKRNIQVAALILGAAAVVVGYREARAAVFAPDASFSRVCLGGLRLDLGAHAPSSAKEHGRLEGDALCRVPGVPKGLPGERLLAATKDGAGVLAHEFDFAPEKALALSVRALELQGWRTTDGTALAVRRGALGRAREMRSPHGVLMATAVPLAEGRRSAVVVATVPACGEGAP